MLTAVQSIDSAILLFIQEHLRVAALDHPMVLISSLGNAGVFWILLGLLLVLIPRTRKHGILALASLLFCFLITNILLKNLVARPRPYTQIDSLIMLMQCPPDFSFPSGHACSSFASSGALAWTCKGRLRPVAYAALTLAALISLSRLYVGVHYPSDVLCGVLIGLLGSLLICALGKRLFARAGHPL